jgi:hypothetical protein
VRRIVIQEQPGASAFMLAMLAETIKDMVESMRLKVEIRLEDQVKGAKKRK